MSVLFLIIPVKSQTILTADGPGDTYNLITSVFAPGYNPIEVPDCNHAAFGPHIDEVFDNTLNTNVFRFHIHTSPDNDRCINFDRQRNEIKTYDKSPDELKGIQGEMVVYKWRFKLESGFQSSPDFTHIHQLKSVGGSLASMPMYTLTTRKGTPNKIELRYAETDSQVTLFQTDISPFIGTWLEVTETITYATNGNYAIKIKRMSDNSTLLSYNNDNIINWREGASFVRPKWGIYRSLNNSQDLRDEVVYFSYFSIEELSNLSNISVSTLQSNVVLYPNPVNYSLKIKNNSNQNLKLILRSLRGQLLIEKKIFATDNLSFIDTSKLAEGVYTINIIGSVSNTLQLIVVEH